MRAAAAAAGADEAYHLGLDFGTSGARVTVIDGSGEVVTEAKSGYGADAAADWAAAWERVLFGLLASLPEAARGRVASLAIDGTSATALLLDAASGDVLAAPKLYNEAQGPDAVAAAKTVAPPAHTAAAATSTLAKLLTWHLGGAWQAAAARGTAPALLHQADWLASLLHGRRDTSDWNNALKLGYDPGLEAYPDWLLSQARRGGGEAAWPAGRPAGRLGRRGGPAAGANGGRAGARSGRWLM